MVVLVLAPPPEALWPHRRAVTRWLESGQHIIHVLAELWFCSHIYYIYIYRHIHKNGDVPFSASSSELFISKNWTLVKSATWTCE